MGKTEDKLFKYLETIVPHSPFRPMQIGKVFLYVDDIKAEHDPLYAKYLKAKAMQDDERSMSYIAKRLGYNHPSGVKYLLDKFTPEATDISSSESSGEPPTLRKLAKLRRSQIMPSKCFAKNCNEPRLLNGDVFCEAHYQEWLEFEEQSHLRESDLK